MYISDIQNFEGEFDLFKEEGCLESTCHIRIDSILASVYNNVRH